MKKGWCIAPSAPLPTPGYTHAAIRRHPPRRISAWCHVAKLHITHTLDGSFPRLAADSAETCH